jgi:hypothetical protein
MRAASGSSGIVPCLSSKPDTVEAKKKQLGKYEMMKQLTMWRNNPDPHRNFLKEAPLHASRNSPPVWD